MKIITQTLSARAHVAYLQVSLPKARVKKRDLPGGAWLNQHYANAFGKGLNIKDVHLNVKVPHSSFKTAVYKTMCTACFSLVLVQCADGFYPVKSKQLHWPDMTEGAGK